MTLTLDVSAQNESSLLPFFPHHLERFRGFVCFVLSPPTPPIVSIFPNVVILGRVVGGGELGAEGVGLGVWGGVLSCSDKWGFISVLGGKSKS